MARKKDRRPSHSVSRKTTSDNVDSNDMKNSVSQDELREAFLWALEEHDKRRSASGLQYQHKTMQEMKLKQKVLFVLKMPFVKSKEVQGNETMVMFMSFVFSIIFSVMRTLFLLVSAASIIIPVGCVVTQGLTRATFVIVVLSLAILFGSYVFAGVFRRMAIESGNIQDEKYAIALFSALGTLVSFIVAMISLVK